MTPARHRRRRPTGTRRLLLAHRATEHVVGNSGPVRRAGAARGRRTLLRHQPPRIEASCAQHLRTARLVRAHVHFPAVLVVARLHEGELQIAGAPRGLVHDQPGLRPRTVAAAHRPHRDHASAIRTRAARLAPELVVLQRGDESVGIRDRRRPSQRRIPGGAHDVALGIGRVAQEPAVRAPVEAGHAHRLADRSQLDGRLVAVRVVGQVRGDAQRRARGLDHGLRHAAAPPDPRSTTRSASAARPWQGCAGD